MNCGIASLLLIPLIAVVATPQQADVTFSDHVNLVVLDVRVRDSRNGYVSGLDKKEFRVLEDGKARAISQFASVDSPVTVGLVVDNSGSMRSKRSEVLQAGLAFARSCNREDEFFVVNFNNSVVSGLPPELPFTDNLNILQRALYYGKPTGQTALYDALSFSLRHLETAHREQRTLIVVSDGGDNVSKISVLDLIAEIELSRATIYTIGLVDPDNSDLNPGVLRRFAAISGGEYFQPRKLDEVLPIFEKISKDIRNRYTIGFVPDEVNDHREIRTVKVMAEHDGRKLTVRARTTYRIPSFAGKV